jgi:hypothetical protein
MRKLGVLMVLIFLAPCVMAQTSSGTLGGTVPFAYSWTTTWNPSIGTLLNSVNATNYNAGYIDLPSIILSSSIQTNDDCKIAVKMGTWTVPAGYPASGDKVDMSPDSDLLFMITGIIPAEEMSIVAPFTALSYLTTSDQDCLDADDADGVATTTFGADARVDMVWGVDLAGAYSVEITLTISQL